MPNINGIVSLINTALQAGQFANRRFQPCQYYGIADPVKITGEDSGDRTEPQIIDNDGEAISLVFDDNNAVQVYHQQDNISYEIAPVDYGKPGTTMREIVDMRLIFAANRSRVQTDNLSCASAIAMDFPKEFTAAQLTATGNNYGIIEMGEVETNPYSVWESEFPGSPFGLNLNTIFISVKYKLTLEYNKNCFSICN